MNKTSLPILDAPQSTSNRGFENIFHLLLLLHQLILFDLIDPRIPLMNDKTSISKKL
jgi:hypothetical protein